MDIVTAFPRSGTGFTSSLLKNAGVDMGHEIIGEQGVVSWLHIAKGTVPWLREPIPSNEWDKIIHLVRHPLKVIASAQTLSDESFEYMFKSLKDHPGGNRSVRWYMWAWLKWNEFIESKSPIDRFRVEDLVIGNESLKKFEAHFGIEEIKEIPKKNVNTRPHSRLTWYDLEVADPALCEQIILKAEEYGYPKFRFGAVMMAKNEEKNIRRCLESIRGIVDEIIVVDTGSEDNTVMIAKEFGAKVYHHPWENNFSLHRNQSLNYSTCDWVLQIDCDEELNGDAGNLRDYVEAVCHYSKYNAIAIQLRDIHGGKQTMQFNVARIFKRGAVHFEDIVHNRPVFDGDAAMPIGDVSYWLHHYGYDLDPDAKQKKLIRTKTLLEKRIKENAEDYEAYFYLSQIEGQNENPEKVLELISFYIKNRKKCLKFNRSAFFTHLQALIAVHGIKDDRVKDALHKYMNELPEDLDITFAALVWARENKKTKLLLEASKRFIECYHQYTKDAHLQASRFTYNYQPECLSEAYFFVATISFSEAIKALNNFSAAVEFTNEDFKEKAVHDMEGACKKLGVGWEKPKNV